MRRWLAQLRTTDRLPGFTEAKRCSEPSPRPLPHRQRRRCVGLGPGRPRADADRRPARHGTEPRADVQRHMYPALALSSNGEHSAAAVAGAFARYRNKLAAERGPGVLFPDRGKATVGGAEADPAEIDAAYADLCTQRETADRRAAQQVEAAVSAKRPCGQPSQAARRRGSEKRTGGGTCRTAAPASGRGVAARRDSDGVRPRTLTRRPDPCRSARK